MNASGIGVGLGEAASQAVEGDGHRGVIPGDSVAAAVAAVDAVMAVDDGRGVERIRVGGGRVAFSRGGRGRIGFREAGVDEVENR